MCRVVSIQPTSECKPVCVHSTHVGHGLQGSHIQAQQACVCVRTRAYLSVLSGSRAGMCRPSQAPPWHCPPAPPICRECPGPGGARRPGNLSQLLCPVSGKPPAGELPAEPACLCTCPLGFQEADGERPCPQPCRPVSTAQTHRWSGECAAGFLSLLRSPSQPEPAETQEGKLRHPQGPLAKGPSSQGGAPHSKSAWGRRSVQRTFDLGKSLQSWGPHVVLACEGMRPEGFHLLLGPAQARVLEGTVVSVPADRPW